MDITDLFENRQKNRMEIFDLVSKSEYGKTNRLFWWNDPTYIIGGVTERERHIWVVNKSLGKFHSQSEFNINLEF